MVNDHSRLTYGELLGDEHATTVTAFVERALAWSAERGITARRLMTDGASSCTRKRSLAGLLGRARDPPHRHAALHAALEGKVERFHQTMEREWATGPRYRNHDSRCGSAALRA